MFKRKDEIIWLSHSLAKDTPAYGGGVGLEIAQAKKLTVGDSCNAVNLKLSNHLGTHVDVPYHFIENGKTINDYSEIDWIFNNPLLIEILVSPGMVIEPEIISAVLPLNRDNIDLLLIKTNFEQYRQKEIYWKNGPAFSPELAGFLKQRFQDLKAIGFDTISLTSYQHRALGRKAHKSFLSTNIRIFEDMLLSTISSASYLKQVWAFPLRFDEADGAPCTIVAVIGNE